MIKKNILITGLNGKESRKIATILAEKLEINFVDLNHLITEKLQQDDALQNISAKKIERIKNDAIGVICNSNYSICFIDSRFIFEQKNIEKLKNNAIIVYFRYKKDDISTNKLSFNNSYAFEIEDKLLQEKCDITIEMSTQTTIESILKGIKLYVDKGENV